MGTEISRIVNDSIKTHIYTVRGVQIMFDRDLAELYGVETRIINQSVKRNFDRFPAAFCFQLNEEDYNRLRSQFVILNTNNRGQHTKYLPYAFTEQGVAMLSSVLHSETAVRVSVSIMNAFVEMRHVLSVSGSLYDRVERLEDKQDRIESRQTADKLEIDGKFDKVFKALAGPELPKQGIFSNGQIYDAYEFASDLIRSAKKSLVLIDNYVDDSVLTMMDKRKSGVKAVVYTKTISKQFALDVQKHNAQYNPVEVRTVPAFHDRFLIIDEKELYHIGASLKDLGTKVFAFSRLELPVAETMKTLGVTA